MHYHHAYHAGNFADVHKHIVLVALIEALQRKDTPFSYLDTHAGAGRYDLKSAAALTTGEAASGALLLEKSSSLPEVLARWHQIVASFNNGEAWQRYPGSPAFAQAMLRPNDRMVLCESVPEVVEELRLAMHSGTIHQRDGYEAHSLLPPPEKRGLVLIDPPFERRDEFEAMESFLTKAQARFAGGIYAFWYPLKNTHEGERFKRRVAAVSSKPVIDFCFDTGAEAQGQMRGAGIVVVNPPYRLDETLKPSLDALAFELAQGQRAVSTITWLKAEA